MPPTITYAPYSWADWLRREVDIRKWTHVALARMAGISAQQARGMLDKNARPIDQVRCIAHALGQPPLVVFYHAGLIAQEDLVTPIGVDSLYHIPVWMLLAELERRIAEDVPIARHGKRKHVWTLLAELERRLGEDSPIPTPRERVS